MTARLNRPDGVRYAPRMSPAARAEQILRAIDAGFDTVPAIAHHLGVSRTVVDQVLRMHPGLIDVHGITSPGRSGAPPRRLTRAGAPAPVLTEAELMGQLEQHVRAEPRLSLTALHRRARPLSLLTVRTLLERLVDEGRVVRAKHPKASHHCYLTPDQVNIMTDDLEDDGWEPARWVHPYSRQATECAS